MTAIELADSDDYLALLRGVLTDPAADVPRLVLADWLEENGQGDRAEFIRVQVGRHATGAFGMGRRERRLVQDGWAMPLAGVFAAAKCGDLKVSWVWRRGFVASVRMMQAQFLEHAAAIFSRHPVTTVTLAGVAPACVIDTDRGGVRTRYGLSRVDLPPARPPDPAGHGYDFSTWAQASMGWVDRGIPRRTRAGEVARRQDFGYPTEAAAMTALSWDCVCYGRELAGLPPIPAP